MGSSCSASAIPFLGSAPGLLLLFLASRWQARPGKNSKNVRVVGSCFDLVGSFPQTRREEKNSLKEAKGFLVGISSGHTAGHLSISYLKKMSLYLCLTHTLALTHSVFNMEASLAPVCLLAGKTVSGDDSGTSPYNPVNSGLPVCFLAGMSNEVVKTKILKTKRLG